MENMTLFIEKKDGMAKYINNILYIEHRIINKKHTIVIFYKGKDEQQVFDEHLLLNEIKELSLVDKKGKEYFKYEK